MQTVSGPIHYWAVRICTSVPCSMAEGAFVCGDLSSEFIRWPETIGNRLLSAHHASHQDDELIDIVHPFAFLDQIPGLEVCLGGGQDLASKFLAGPRRI